MGRLTTTKVGDGLGGRHTHTAVHGDEAQTPGNTSNGGVVAMATNAAQVREQSALPLAPRYALGFPPMGTPGNAPDLGNTPPLLRSPGPTSPPSYLQNKENIFFKCSVLYSHS